MEFEFKKKNEYLPGNRNRGFRHCPGPKKTVREPLPSKKEEAACIRGSSDKRSEDFICSVKNENKINRFVRCAQVVFHYVRLGMAFVHGNVKDTQTDRTTKRIVCEHRPDILIILPKKFSKDFEGFSKDYRGRQQTVTAASF